MLFFEQVPLKQVQITNYLRKTKITDNGSKCIHDSIN